MYIRVCSRAPGDRVNVTAATMTSGANKKITGAARFRPSRWNKGLSDVRSSCSDDGVQRRNRNMFAPNKQVNIINKTFYVHASVYECIYCVLKYLFGNYYYILYFLFFLSRWSFSLPKENA